MSSKPDTAARIYWPELDGLRFLAALLVFIHHSDQLAGVPEFLKAWGWVGVDLFLVLSAFLLTRLLRVEIERSSAPNYRHYFIRRICRIWPLHWTFISAMLLLSFVTKPGQVTQSIGVWFSHIAFFNNFVIGIFGYESELPYSAHLWTISLEEQYYLLVPLLVPFLLRLRGRNTAALVLAAALVGLWLARALCVVLEVHHPFIWTSPLRMDAMLLGTAMGIGIIDVDALRTRASASFAAGLLVLFAATFLPSARKIGWGQIPLYTIVDTGCALLVIGSLGSRRIGAFLSTPLLRYLGKVSFGIYVYHILVLRSVGSLARANGVTDPWMIFLASLLATCLVSALSYELFEKRFLRLKKRYTTVESRPV
jgi:peptidoglycan/LPS O-acetylase OafA/YrhL